MFHPIVDCEHPLLCLLGPGIASQATAISGSFQQNLAAVSEDGLVSHQWKERPIGLANFICLSTGEHQGQEVGVGG